MRASQLLCLPACQLSQPCLPCPALPVLWCCCALALILLCCAPMLPPPPAGSVPLPDGSTQQLLTREEAAIVQRFDPSAPLDTIGFFIAKCVKAAEE